MRYYAASSGSSVPTFRENRGPIVKGQEVVSRNVGTELPLDAA
jgi:hypothetical protein